MLPLKKIEMWIVDPDILGMNLAVFSEMTAQLQPSYCLLISVCAHVKLARLFNSGQAMGSRHFDVASRLETKTARPPDVE